MLVKMLARRKLLVALPAAFIILGIAVPAIAIANPTGGLNGDCATAATPDGYTVFEVHDALNRPVAGVQLAAAGSTQYTNSSGVAVFRGDNFTDFSVSDAGGSFHVVLGGYQLVVCAGDSYYRYEWVTANGGVQAQADQGLPQLAAFAAVG